MKSPIIAIATLLATFCLANPVRSENMDIACKTNTFTPNKNYLNLNSDETKLAGFLSNTCDRLYPVSSHNKANENPALELKQQYACLINGTIDGIDRLRGRSLSVVIFNPNSGSALGKVQANPTTGNYQIGMSRSGRYLLRVFRNDNRGLLSLNTNPNQRLVNCVNGSSIRDADFQINS